MLTQCGPLPVIHLNVPRRVQVSDDDLPVGGVSLVGALHHQVMAVYPVEEVAMQSHTVREVKPHQEDLTVAVDHTHVWA